MAVCTGCGLRDDGAGGAEVATPVAFGVAPLDVFGGDDSVGAPVYCDEVGELRTVPEHTSRAGDFSASAGVNSAMTATGPAVTLSIVNPSLVRAASVLYVFSMKVGFHVAAAGFSIYGAVQVDGGAPADQMAQYWGVPIGPNNLDGSPGEYDHEVYLTEHVAATIAAGATGSLTVTPRIDAGGGSGRFTSQGVGIRAILATV